MEKTVSRQTLQRLPIYLNYLKSLPGDCGEYISATAIADGLGLNDVQVRKDLAQISSGGRPKVGYNISALTLDIENYLGCGEENRAVLVGVGNLGRALVSYGGFAKYGLDIVAVFDADPRIVGESVNGKPVMGMDSLKAFCEKNSIRLGIISVPEQAAQTVCDSLIDGGVIGIWNFAPAHLSVPDSVLVQNENMASSLAVLSKHLSKKLKSEKG